MSSRLLLLRARKASTAATSDLGTPTRVTFRRAEMGARLRCAVGVRPARVVSTVLLQSMPMAGNHRRGIPMEVSLSPLLRYEPESLQHRVLASLGQSTATSALLKARRANSPVRGRVPARACTRSRGSRFRRMGITKKVMAMERDSPHRRSPDNESRAAVHRRTDTPSRMADQVRPQPDPEWACTQHNRCRDPHETEVRAAPTSTITFVVDKRRCVTVSRHHHLKYLTYRCPTSRTHT